MAAKFHSFIRLRIYKNMKFYEYPQFTYIRISNCYFSLAKRTDFVLSTRYVKLVRWKGKP